MEYLVVVNPATVGCRITVKTKVQTRVRTRTSFRVKTRVRVRIRTKTRVMGRLRTRVKFEVGFRLFMCWKCVFYYTIPLFHVLRQIFSLNKKKNLGSDED